MSSDSVTTFSTFASIYQQEGSSSPLGLCRPETACGGGRSLPLPRARTRSLADDFLDDETGSDDDEDGDYEGESFVSSASGTAYSRRTFESRSTGATTTFDDDDDDEEEDEGVQVDTDDEDDDSEDDMIIRSGHKAGDLIRQLSLDRQNEELAIEIMLEDSMLQLESSNNAGGDETEEEGSPDDVSFDSAAASGMFGPTDSLRLDQTKQSFLRHERSDDPPSEVTSSASSHHRRAPSGDGSIVGEEYLKPQSCPTMLADKSTTSMPKAPLDTAEVGLTKKPKRGFFKRIVKGIKKRGGKNHAKTRNDMVIEVIDDIAVVGPRPGTKSGGMSGAEPRENEGALPVDEDEKPTRANGSLSPSEPVFLSADDPSMDPDLHMSPTLVPVRISHVSNSRMPGSGYFDDADASHVSSLSGTVDTSIASQQIQRNMSMDSASVKDVCKALRLMEAQLGKASCKGQKVSRQKVMSALLTVAENIEERKEMQNELSNLIARELVSAREEEDDDNLSEDDSDLSSASSSSMGDFAKEVENVGWTGLFDRIFSPTVKDSNGVDRVLEDLESLARKQSVSNTSTHTTTDDVPKSIPMRTKREARSRDEVEAVEVRRSVSSANRMITKAPPATPRTKEKVSIKRVVTPERPPANSSNTTATPTRGVPNNKESNAGKASPNKIKPLPPPREKMTPGRARYSMSSPAQETITRAKSTSSRPALKRMASATSAKSNRSGISTPMRSWWRRRSSQSKGSADCSTEPSVSTTSQNSSYDKDEHVAVDDEAASLNAFFESEPREDIEKIVDEELLKRSIGSAAPAVTLRRTTTAKEQLDNQLRHLNLSPTPMRSMSSQSRPVSPQSTVHILLPNS